MISDTLLKAIDEIREYQHRQPSMYAETKNKIDALVEQMEALVKELYDPPYAMSIKDEVLASVNAKLPRRPF